MKQEEGKILPKFINTDSGYESLKEDESPYMKGLSWDINANPGAEIGTANPSGEGQNLLVLTPARSNAAIDSIPLPSGYNKSYGTFESKVTNELYHFNYNEQGNHGIYVIDGNTGVSKKVVVDSELGFTDMQEHTVFNRVCLRLTKDASGNISEKYLMWTDGNKWQGWVNVIAATETDGFNKALFPYWRTMPPHFDRRELLEWPVRPPMIKPVIGVIANTAAELGVINRVADKNFRFAYSFEYTDGRATTVSPYSLPLQIKTEEFINNLDSIPKRAKITLYAGSPMVEKIKLYVQRGDATNSIDATAVYGDWILYDTIEKFDTAADGQYWLRQNQWNDFNYNSAGNTIEYIFDNSKAGSIVSQKDIIRIQSGMPQISQALTDIDNSVLLCNNRYGYKNLAASVLDNFSVTVKEKAVQSCSAPMRTIYLYAYIGMCGSNFSYTSQVGYINGDDKQVRFGGLRMRDVLIGGKSTINVDESKFFKLDFADRDSLRVYLKGTPYYADGEWCIVSPDNSIEEIDGIYDFSSEAVLKQVYDIFKSGSYFMCRFKLNVPAGKYIATLGRHNEKSSGDYRGKSTYIYGIANSRQKSQVTIGTESFISIKPNAIRTFSKEMEIDCISGDVDVWGANNNEDLFYVYCPYNRVGGNSKYRFIEGYLKESKNNLIPVEMFPYQMDHAAADDWGKETDKNGFYWAFTKVSNADNVSIQFFSWLNCGAITQFTVATSGSGSGWMKNADAYIDNYGGSGACNWVEFTGSVKDLSGNIGYSGIAISMKDGATVYTRSDGEFTMKVHNGRPTPRASNVIVNAGGNYIMTLDNCASLPAYSYNEALIPCQNCNERIYPIPLHINVVIQNNTQTSLKDGAKYNVGGIFADLAGRCTYVNFITGIDVDSYLQRNNINATYFQLQFAAANIAADNPDLKWFSPVVSKNVTSKRYMQWIADKMVYLDNNGNEVKDAVSASFVKLVTDSLFQANLQNNFSLLSSYQFAKGDRLRVIDNGDILLSVSSFGNPIDVQVLGTSYNQAAINAGILPGTTIQQDATETGIIVRYDSRFDILSDKTGFWIEVYSPVQESEVIPYFEAAGFMPIINGAISDFTGNPVSEIDIEFWDTYYLQRSILGKYYGHPFESPNVTDNWGKNITSGGRLHVENRDAEQKWYGGDTIRSDSFVNRNGLSTFREENRKDYGIYPFGEIIVAHTRRNEIAFNCKNDWFVAEFNQPYTKISNGQMVVTNLDENLSLPRQKSGAMFGIDKEDIGTLITDGDMFFWYDRKNTSIVKSNYSGAVDITQESEGERGGIQSYINTKQYHVNTWNAAHENKDRFDVIAGIDAERGNLYFTFRPRRAHSTDPLAFISRRRNLDLKSAETFVYSIQYHGWLPCVNFAPEAYGRLKGNWANVEMITFMAGKPYIHNNTDNDSFLNYYGVQCEPVVIVSLNKEGGIKIFQSLSYDCHGSELFCDHITDEQTNSYSYIPSSMWKEREHIFYAPFLRDMASYPVPGESFRSMLHDGKRIFGNFALARLVQIKEDLGKYFQLSDIRYLFTNSHPTKP